MFCFIKKSTINKWLGPFEMVQLQTLDPVDYQRSPHFMADMGECGVHRMIHALHVHRLILYMVG